MTQKADKPKIGCGVSCYVKILFLHILLILFLVSCSQPKNTIPPEDLETLENFFELLIKEGDFAYTLFGNKPCSLIDYDSKDPLSFQSYLLEEGWRCWSRYEHLFPSQNFVLKNLDRGPIGTRNCREIFLINKKATLETLKNHIDFIWSRTDTNFHEEELLNKIIESDEFLIKLISQSDVLGILLGYGKENALDFEKRRTLSIAIHEQLASPTQEEFHDLTEKSRLFVKGYGESDFKEDVSSHKVHLSFLIKELNAITASHKVFELPGRDLFLEKIQSPVYSAVLDREETKQLQKSYSETRDQVNKAYSSNSFFKTTIDQWMQGLLIKIS